MTVYLLVCEASPQRHVPRLPELVVKGNVWDLRPDK
jgi:hypothetical protein